MDPLGYDPEAVQVVCHAPPWHCPACHGPIGPAPGTGWLQDFKRHPSHDGNWPQVPAAFVAYEELPQPDARRLVFDENWHRPTTPEHTSARWFTTYLFEEFAALWDTTLRMHRGCQEGDHVAHMSQFRGVEFQCPVAAAALKAMSALGCPSEAGGRWPTWRVAGPGLQDRSFTLLPEWQQQLVAGDVAKYYLYDALMLFADVANTGKKYADWTPPARIDSKSLLQVGPKQSGIFVSLVSRERLQRAVRRAERFCPKQRQ